MNNSSLIPKNIHLKIGNSNIKILLLLFVRRNKRKHTSEKSHSIATRQASSRIALETFQRFRRRARFLEKILPKSFAEEKNVLDVRVTPQLSTFRFFGSRIPFSTCFAHLVFHVQRRFAWLRAASMRRAKRRPPTYHRVSTSSSTPLYGQNIATTRTCLVLDRWIPSFGRLSSTLRFPGFRSTCSSAWFHFRIPCYSRRGNRKESKAVERREGCKKPWSIYI